MPHETNYREWQYHKIKHIVTPYLKGSCAFFPYIYERLQTCSWFDYSENENDG